MTVRELIEELKKFPEDMTVVNYEYFLIHDVDKELINGEEYVVVN